MNTAKHFKRTESNLLVDEKGLHHLGNIKSVLHINTYLIHLFSIAYFLMNAFMLIKSHILTVHKSTLLKVFNYT